MSHAAELAYLFDYSDWLQMYDYYTTIPDPGRSDANLYRVLMGAWTQVHIKVSKVNNKRVVINIFICK